MSDCNCNDTSILFPGQTNDPSPFNWEELMARVQQLIPEGDWAPIAANAHGAHPAFPTRITYEIWALAKLSAVVVTPLSLVLTVLSPTTVNGSDGTITAKASGGTGPYKYKRSTSNTYSAVTSEEYLFSGIPAGNIVIDVMDSVGGTFSKVVNVPAPGANAIPVANAGVDKTIQLPTTTVTLSGSGTDSDGTIAAYAWAQLTGPVSTTLTGANTNSVTVSGLTTAGNYTFALIVTDNKGATSVQDTVQVTVTAATVVTPTIFSFTPTSGVAGSTVEITGTNFSGVTNVRFNGLFSNFVVNSTTKITATVPASGTTGKIIVETSNGNATSANNFTVTVPVTYNTTLNAATPEGAGVSFNPASTEELKFNAIPNANQTFINAMFTYNGATSYATMPGEYTGQGFSFKDNAGALHTGTFSNNG